MAMMVILSFNTLHRLSFDTINLTVWLAAGRLMLFIQWFLSNKVFSLIKYFNYPRRQYSSFLISAPITL